RADCRPGFTLDAQGSRASPRVHAQRLGFTRIVLGFASKLGAVAGVGACRIECESMALVVKQWF
ncbi:hypothetical protein, partial [Mycobacterium kiyosense]|uniref:hypothetical protein n=1 Tax=Mycobacterium kiyosense TaxID=2871094 RepID=UPI00222FD9A3